MNIARTFRIHPSICVLICDNGWTCRDPTPTGLMMFPVHRACFHLPAHMNLQRKRQADWSAAGMSKIQIPVAAFDQHIIVLGKTRSGKSSAMRVLVEYLLDKQEPPVTIVDPQGDWWGLKASADGKSAGYPVVIFGGEHGDVPLNARSGSICS